MNSPSTRAEVCPFREIEEGGGGGGEGENSCPHPHLISYYVQGFIILFTAVECVGLFKMFCFLQKSTFALDSS
jgi:hypothetical protein